MVYKPSHSPAQPSPAAQAPPLPSTGRGTGWGGAPAAPGRQEAGGHTGQGDWGRPRPAETAGWLGGGEGLQETDLSHLGERVPEGSCTPAWPRGMAGCGHAAHGHRQPLAAATPQSLGERADLQAPEERGGGPEGQGGWPQT